MHLKTFEAPTLDEALRQVRRNFGNDALIVATDDAFGGAPARVTAARERENPNRAIPPAISANGTPVEDPIPRLRYALAESGVSAMFASDLLAAAHFVETPVAPAIALAAAFDGSYRFKPLTTKGGTGLLATEGRTTYLLVGPPGSGKTVTAAKLMARACATGASVRAVTIDTRKTGGTAHLQILAERLQVAASVAGTPSELAATIAADTSDVTFIDTFGINPFAAAEIEDLSSFIGAAQVEPILILPAGGDPQDSADMTAAFSALGCRRAIVTRVDLTRRLGSVLAAFHRNRIAFSDVSVSPDILPVENGGLTPLNPVALARLILKYTEDGFDAESASASHAGATVA